MMLLSVNYPIYKLFGLSTKNLLIQTYQIVKGMQFFSQNSKIKLKNSQVMMNETAIITR